MRRFAFLGIIGVAASACSWDSTNFDYQSTLYQRTDGVALKGYEPLYGGNRAQVGMNTLTCEVDLQTAMLGNDYDYEGLGSDHVGDAGLINGEMGVVITNGDRLYIQHDDFTADMFDAPGAQVGVVTNDGAAALVDNGGCGVQWVGASDATYMFAAGDCAGFNLTVDPVSGEAFVGADSGVTQVTPNGSQVVTEEASQLVAWDATAEVLYTAEFGWSELRGLEADGSERFRVDVGASIWAIDDMGTRGAAIVSVSNPDGSGGVVVVDGLTGIIETSQGTPSAISSVVGAPDGGSIALVDADQVHFYRVGAYLGAPSDEQSGGLAPILGF